jgi:hypothetical protein
MPVLIGHIALTLLFILLLVGVNPIFAPVYVLLLLITKVRNRLAKAYITNPASWFLAVILLAGPIRIIWAINHPLPSGFLNQNELIGSILFEHLFAAAVAWAYAVWWRRLHSFKMQPAPDEDSTSVS